MRFLLFQNRPAIRVYKLAWTLQSLGHEVAIAHKARRPPIAEHAWLAARLLHVPMSQSEHLALLSRAADVTVYFNADVMAQATDGDRRVTFVGDLSGLRENGAEHADVERDVLRSSAGLMFVSEAQQELAEREYGPLGAPRIAIHNGPLEEMCGGDAVERLSAADGRVHVVYSGMMQPESGTPRDVVPVLERLLAEPEIVVHVIPGAATKVPAAVEEHASSGRLVLEQTVPSRDVVAALRRFDVGLIYVDEAYPQIRDTMRPNKLYEYRAAGLAVVANDGAALRGYLGADGAVFARLDEVGDAVRAARPPSRPVETWESQAAQIDAFFRGLEVAAAVALSRPRFTLRRATSKRERRDRVVERLAYALSASPDWRALAGDRKWNAAVAELIAIEQR